LVGSWVLFLANLLFCTGKYCNTATTNLLCARGRIKTSQKKISHNNLIMVLTRRLPQKKTRPTGVPTLSGQVCVPAGAHPARIGARLRLDAPRRGGNGGGVGLDVVAGGEGADWATCLRLLERAAAAAAAATDVARDGAALTAASSTRVGGGLFVPGGELNEIKN